MMFLKSFLSLSGFWSSFVRFIFGILWCLSQNHLVYGPYYFLYICNHLAVVAKEEKSIRVIWGKRVPFYWTKNVCTFLRDQTKQETRVQKLVIAQPAAWPNSSLLLETRRRHGRFCHKFDLFHSKLSCKTLSSQNHMPLICTLNSISYNNQQLSETLL